VLPALPADSELSLSTDRLVLEPITTAHAEEIHALFSDEELHRFVPFEPLSLEDQRAQCATWQSRRSPDGKELWLNWAARYREQVIGHFQIGVENDGVGVLGYLVARAWQRQGFAAEALRAVMTFARERLHVVEYKAWIDTRNCASVALVERLGLQQIAVVQAADFFKGAQSDEYVFSIRLTEL